MTVGQLSFKYLPLLLLFYMNYPPITCQNCGLPTTIRVSDQLTEILDTGQPILPPIPAKNVVKISKIIHNPGNFTSITLNPETESSSAMLTLEVETPLWEHSEISFIDKLRILELAVEVELECSDGRFKKIKIVVPIRDENTAIPFYEKNHFNLKTEPCLMEKCALIFDTDIIAIDQDRDEENAKMHMWTDKPHMINILHGYSTMSIWYDKNEFGVLQPQGYQSKIKLEYVPEDKSRWPKSITFTMYVNNTVPFVNPKVLITTSTVTITFEENSHRVLPPQFTSPVYYAFVEYEGELVYTKPRNIYASVPGLNYSELDIEYWIEGEPDMFHIDCQGNLSFIRDIGVRSKLSNTIVSYNVTANRSKVIEGKVMAASSKVPLIVFFDKHGSTPEPPPDCECGSTTPWPGVCPLPICPGPEPDPCPGITTTAQTTTASSHTTTSIPSTTTPEYTTEWEETTITTPEYTTESEETIVTTPEMVDSTTDTTSDQTPTQPTTPEASDTTTDPDPTTTFTPPILPPGKCTCNCTDFTCADPQAQPSLNSTLYRYYPDPYFCTKYHRCPNKEGWPVDEGETQTFTCPEYTVFCPIMSACTTVEMCIQRTFPGLPPTIKGGYGDGSGGGSGGSDEDEECHECQCSTGFPPGHVENLCTPDNYQELIPDKKFCDVFHKCQPWRTGYIDYPMRCQPGLVFCPRKGACGYHYDPDCVCGTNLHFQQCDVCIMGLWSGFDIFVKQFL